jgi:hypothetical protein
MGVTFNTSDGIQGGFGGTGLYAHIVDIAGPKKFPATTDPVIAEHWDVTYGVIVHKDQTTRNDDWSPWSKRVMFPTIDRFKWSAANLDTHPTLPNLYAHLKTELSERSNIDAIQDAI